MVNTSDYGYGLSLLVLVNVAVTSSSRRASSTRARHAIGRPWEGSRRSCVLPPAAVRLGGSRFESRTPTHDGGHRWSELIGWKGDPPLSPFHLASHVYIADAAVWDEGHTVRDLLPG